MNIFQSKFTRAMAISALLLISNPSPIFAAGEVGAGASGAVAKDSGLYDKNSQVTFFSALPDVPVMAGLIEAEDLAVVYDKPEGRFVEVLAVGDPQEHEISAYYKEVLPQMGWVETGTNSYKRQKEKLEVRYDSHAPSRVVRITVAPY